MTFNDLNKNWQNFWASGRGTWIDWYKSFGKKNGVNILHAIKYAGQEKGLTPGQLTVKYGVVIKEDIGSPLGSVISGMGSGLSVGGPLGAVVGAFVGVAAHDAKERAAGNAAKAEAAAIKALPPPPPVNTSAQQNTVQAGMDLLTFDGPKLWALGILLIFVFVLFFTKKNHA